MTLATRIWLCMACGDTFELPAGEGPLRDEHRHVYCCSHCLARGAALDASLDEGPRS